MDIKAYTRNMIVTTDWILVLLIIVFSTTVQGESNYNSHKTSGISHIPWNILLDPNYTSHKQSSSLNRTSFSPSLYDEYPPKMYFSHQQNSASLVKDSASPVGYYVPPPKTQFSSNQGIKYSSPFRPSDLKPSNSFSAPVISHRPTEKIVFPSASKFQVTKTEKPDRYESAPEQQRKKKQQSVKENDAKKQKKRKPDDYFDLEEEEYLDSYYEDYDYPENTRPSYRPSKQPSRIHQYNSGSDPLGLLPSASDPDGFFAKAKDLLRGGSYNRPNYAATSPEYYPSYSPNKHYADSYYDQENIGYPSKDSQYGAPGYDYDTPHYEGNYGGVIPFPDKKKGSKYGPLAFALGLLPLGLLLASLVPTVVTIPVTTAVATGRRKKRSVKFVNPVLEIISEYGLQALEDPLCLNRIFCQVVRDGQQERSSIVQKIYFKIANILDEKIVSYVGMKPLLMAVRKDECHLFPCSTKNRTVELNQNMNNATS